MQHYQAQLDRQEKVRITVRVRWQEDKPLEGAYVAFTYDDLLSSINRITDAKGVAVAEYAPCGRQGTITVTKQGIREHSQKIDLVCERKRIDVTVALAAAPQEN